MHVGRLILDVAIRKNVKPDEFAALIHCERTNLYRIYRREHINTELLERISLALKHNFFRDLADALDTTQCED